MNNKKKQIVKTSVFIASVFVIFISVTYAFINLTLEGTKKHVITAGVLELVLDEDENNLTIENALPMYDEVGMIQEPFTFRLINEGTTSANYVLKIQEINTNELSPTDVKYGLEKNGETTIDFVSNITDNTIDSGIISSNTTIEYTLRLWIRHDLEEISQIQARTMSLRFSITETPVDKYTVSFNTDGGNELEPIAYTYEMAYGSLPTPEKEGYKFLGWYTKEGEEVTTDTLVTMITDDVLHARWRLMVITDELFESDSVGENCKTYNDGVDTFLVGQCSNNYVWYSGKLWRVVLKNNATGAVKMVTDNAITTISYNSSTVFENSYVDQWLTQEFLPTLHDYKDYLVTDSIWDSTNDNYYARPSGTTTTTRTVGLLNAYEHHTTYYRSDGLATASTGYLNNGVYRWLITPESGSFIYIAYGGIMSQTQKTGCGISPAVNIKSTIKMSSGVGTKANPYILEGDVQKPVNGTTLLNTRYSGEYITFNNDLYRIVGIENGLTKITAVDIPSQFSGILFTNGMSSNFAASSTKTTLENYYQGLDTTTKEMIEPNTTWYLGTVNSGTNYKASICATVDAATSTSACEKTTTTTTASIALPRIGEMFTSQMTRGTKTAFWTLTPENSNYVTVNESYNQLIFTSPLKRYGAHPSLYLKSNVVIASDNTGNGTYEKPYSIQLGA